VLRSGHRAAAILTLALDALKGYAPVWLALWLAPRFGFGEITIAGVGLAAFLGHLWPVFFRFEGGKGVATAAGVLLAFNPWLGLATLLTWVIVAVFFRYSSLASIVAAVFAPFYQLLIWEPSAIALAIAIMSLLLIWRHSGNVRTLLAGTESKLGQRSGGAVPATGASPWPRSRQARARHARARQEERAFGMIHRIGTGPRMSEAVVHNGVVYLAGQVATGDASDVTSQTREVLAAVDALLARAGTDKSRLLRAEIFLADMADFAAMNAVWDSGSSPALRQRVPRCSGAGPATVAGRDRHHRCSALNAATRSQASAGRPSNAGSPRPRRSTPALLR
jgi:glycerol-3-phosphate acyltransferase PlsY